jgi:hypothetical protein
MVIEMLFNKKIKIFFFWSEFTFLKKLYSCVHYWKNFMNKISNFSFRQLSIDKIWIIKFEVLCNV